MKISGFLLYFRLKAVYQPRMFRPRSIGLLLAFITLLVYLPTTSYKFISYDDPEYVTVNPFVNQGLTWIGVKWAFAGAHASNWHPLTWLSHMIDCDLFHLNPAGPHLVNILFHALNSALLFALLFRLTKKPWPSAFICALFAWHPLHVESVAWIAERKDVLSTFFALLTLISYTRYAQENRRRSYWFALFFFVLALLSKPMPVTLPVVMLLLDYWPLNRVETHKFKIASATGTQPSTIRFLFSIICEKWPFFLLSAVSCVITCLAQHNAVNSLANVPLGLRLENMVTAYAGYLGKMMWPTQLAIFYPFPSTISRSLIAESILILAGISVIAWRERKNSPWLMVGWLWFLVTLVPVIGLVQVGGQAMADRYSYFPLIGIFLAVSFSMQALAEHFSFLKKWLVVAAVFILVTCVSLTERQLGYWHDTESLFRHSLEVQDSDIAHISLGSALLDQNRQSEALTQFIMAWRKNPGSVLANADIAGILAEQGKPELAMVYYQRAVQGNSWLPLANENYGRVLVTLKRFDEAANQFSLASQIDPSQAQPHYLMGQLYLQQERDAEAAKQFREALKLEPDNLEIMILLASILSASENPQARDGAEAHALASRVVKLTDSQQPAALDALAMSCAENGQFDEAVQIQQRAIKIAETVGQKDGLELLQKRLLLYQKHEPWRDSFKKN